MENAFFFEFVAWLCSKRRELLLIETHCHRLTQLPPNGNTSFLFCFLFLVWLVLLVAAATAAAAVGTLLVAVYLWLFDTIIHSQHTSNGWHKCHSMLLVSFAVVVFTNERVCVCTVQPTTTLHKYETIILEMFKPCTHNCISNASRKRGKTIFSSLYVHCVQ